jgi:hypothetical protein
MDNVILEGKLIQILPLQEGVSTRGAWKKQEFIIETADQYPKKVCIGCWNEKADDLANFNVGDLMKIAVNIESREYNSRWYTDIKAWRIDAVNQQAPAAPNAPAANQSEDVIGMSFSEDEDELPF